MDTFLIILTSLITILAIVNLILFLTRKYPDHSHTLTLIKDNLQSGNGHLEGLVRDEFGRNRQEQSDHLQKFSESLNNQTRTVSEQQFKLIDIMTKSIKDIGEQVDKRLEAIRQDSSAKLEKIRETVDEKLHKTLEERLGRCFKLVSERLEQVQKGLGEMQQLANGVGDLKKVLTNVRTRGVFGEIQLSNILEQILSPDQYDSNVKTIPNSDKLVEFAIKLPGKDEEGSQIWLPIDSKFPMDRYEALIDGYENGDKSQIENERKLLFNALKSAAKDIRDKYLAPPYTTDFGILFLPVEGLYAEVTRFPGVLDELRINFKVIVAGPSNLSAFLSSLQMGFRTLAIEKRSSEVWKILGAVKSEFGTFGEVLSQVQKKLTEASNKIEKAGVRSRAIERQLRDVQELPSSESRLLLPDLDEDPSDLLDVKAI
ncbi:MAG: DNA recombination protein RmuC [Saprospiraceae bacterium]|nr:DNA recombination protein RmuC [Saprospiraceae bacterium]